MAGVSKRPDAFFRLSPAANGKLCWFAIRRGDIENRFDVKYFALRETLASTRYPLKSLGELVCEEPNYGAGSRAIARTVFGQPRYIRITDFGEDGIEPGHEYVTADPIEPGCELTEGDLLFARSGATVGKTYLHEDVSEPALFAGYCIRFRFRQSVALPKFIYWFTKTETYARWVATIQRPAGQPNINKEEFKTVEVPLPGTAEQTRLIVAMETARAERRAKQAEADALLAELDDYLLATLGLTSPPKDERKVFGITRSLAARRFDPQFFHPKHIEIERQLQHACSRDDLSIIGLGELCSKIVQPAEFIREYEDAHENAVRFLRASSVRDGHLDLNDHLFVATEKLERSLQSFIDEGNLLVTRTGAKAGSVCAVPALAHKFAVSSHTLRLIIDRTKAVPEFVELFLISTFGKNQINRLFTGAAQPQLQIKSIQTILVPLPSIQTQHVIANEARRRREEASRLRAQAETGWQAARHWFEEQLLGPASP